MTLTIPVLSLPLAYDADGVIRVGETRITLDAVVNAFRNGSTAEEIVHQYPSLDLADVYQVISYYLQKTDEINAYLNDRHQKSKEIRLQNESCFDPNGIRDRLLSRKS